MIQRYVVLEDLRFGRLLEDRLQGTLRFTRPQSMHSSGWMFAADDGPTLLTVAKLVKSPELVIPHSYDLEKKKEALRLGRELLRGTKYEEQ